MASGKGTVTVDFGSFPGMAEATATVTGLTGITTSSYVEIWADCDNDTADHTVDEHYLEEFVCWTDTLVTNTGFTVRVRPHVGICYGQYKLNHVWST